MKTEYCFIKDKTEDGTISIHYVPTDKMRADISKKFLSASKVATFRIVLKKALLNQLNSQRVFRKSIKR